MSYSDTIDYLYGLRKYGIKLGLEKTDIILSLLGSPHKSFRSLHVAGTNGKGSVSAMLSSILAAHDYTVGLFTSPHLASFTERIRVGKEEITEEEVSALTGEIREALLHSTTPLPEPTFFEFVTAMAFLYFRRKGVQWAVIETGMGGRLDATNILTPAVCIITKVGLDHREFLGNTLAAIAAEKAGIIKPGVPVVCAQQDSEAEQALRTTAADRSSQLLMYGKDFSGKLMTCGLDGITFEYRDSSQTIIDLHTPLPGEHQLSNACLAVRAASLALNAAGPHLRTSALKEGLSSTRWRGRLDMVSRDPDIMIDGAHNPEAALALAEFIKEYLADRKIILVMGIMADKDMDGIMRPLLPLASEIVFTAPNYGRAASAQALSGLALSMGFPAITASSVKEAIDTAVSLSALPSASGGSRTSALILITGSFYTIGEAMETLGEKATLGSLRETL
jgi:dihydrofolate synthase/folylpolyglutamate synthase